MALITKDSTVKQIGKHQSDTQVFSRWYGNMMSNLAALNEHLPLFCYFEIKGSLEKTSFLAEK